MTKVEQLASFAVRACYDDLSADARHHLKLHILDSLGCAIGALQGPPVVALRQQFIEFGGAGPCTYIGGGQTSPDRAACYNTALVRYLDFMDNFLAKRETCHPSDNLGSVLAAAEYANRSGKELMAGLALAYQVQTRLLEEAPITKQGFDHTTQLAYAVAAGVSRMLGLNELQTANALAICGTSTVTLWVTRTGQVPQWKGLLSSQVALGCVNAVFLAKRGVTGPLNLFEGPEGFEFAVSGEFDIDWAKESLENVTHTDIKRFNSEVHSQSVVEAVLDLKEQYAIQGEAVDKVEIEVFETAYNIIGGGKGGDKTKVATKEQADHSLPYVVSVALLDGQVWPDQYDPERIKRSDVQRLLQCVTVKPSRDFTRHYPQEIRCRVTVTMRNGERFTQEKKDYLGFYLRPMSWQQVVGKFERLTSPFIDSSLQRALIDAVDHLDEISVRELTRLLAQVGSGKYKVASPSPATAAAR